MCFLMRINLASPVPISVTIYFTLLLLVSFTYCLLPVGLSHSQSFSTSTGYFLVLCHLFLAETLILGYTN
jgi:hypothetical protein